MSPHVPHQVADGSGSGTRRQRWRRIVVAVAAVLVAALCTRLGLWQLDRAAQKLALQARIEARGAMPPLANAELTARSQGAPQRRPLSSIDPPAGCAVGARQAPPGGALPRASTLPFAAH